MRFFAVVLAYVLAALYVGGCVSSGVFSVGLRAIESSPPPTAWFVDGPEMVITVRNTSSRRARGVLRCVGSAYAPSWPIDLAAGEEWRGLGQVLNRDLHANPCWVDDVVVGGGR